MCVSVLFPVQNVPISLHFNLNQVSYTELDPVLMNCRFVWVFLVLNDLLHCPVVKCSLRKKQQHCFKHPHISGSPWKNLRDVEDDDYMMAYRLQEIATVYSKALWV